MAVADAQLSQTVALLTATFCYICRQVLRVFARRDAFHSAATISRSR